MTAEEQAVIRERLRGLEEEVREARNLARAVGENTATLRVLLNAHSEIVKEIAKLRDDFDDRIEKIVENTRATTSFRTLMTFAATIIVPILLALIGGYFALKGAQVPRGK